MVRTNLLAFGYGAFAIGLFTVMAALKQWGVVSPAAQNWDAVLLHAATGGLAYLAFFSAGHFACRHFQIRRRAAYVALGSAACIFSFSIMLEPGAFGRMIAEGTTSITFMIPAAVGALVGFLYHARAGYDTGTDNPDLLARVLGQAQTHDRKGGSFVSADRSHVGTGLEEYFDGPLQVRTSFGVMLVAAFGGTFISKAAGAAVAVTQIVLHPEGRDMASLANEVLTVAGFAGVTFLAIVVYGLIPFAGVIFIGHQACRALDKTSLLAYGVAGLITPIALGFLTLFAYASLGFFVAVPSAIAMVMYRKLAGVEPKPVKEDIEVRERRDLVGANHARRSFGRVIARPEKAHVPPPSGRG